MRARLTATLCLVVGAGWAQSPFPTAAARTYLEATAPHVDAAGMVVAAPATLPGNAVAAQATLRKLAQSGDSESRTLALLALGKGESNRHETAAARTDLEAAASGWAPVRDAATAALTALLAEAHDDAGTLAAANAWTGGAQDAFYSPIGLAAASAAQRLGQGQQVLHWTEPLAATPAIVWLRVQATEQTGAARAAAELYRSLVYRYPASPEALLAAPEWQRMLTRFPELAADWLLTSTQAQAWNTARRYREAARAWSTAATMAPAAQQPDLQASAARAWLAAGDRATATAGVVALLHGPERAQALELELELARGTKDQAGIDANLEALQSEFGTSEWYARGLHEAGDEALLENQPARIEADFDALVQKFPTSSYAANAAWQATWAAYRQRAADTPERLEQYLVKFPHASADVDALYWRGRWAQDHQQPELAQACWQTAARRYPGTYFGIQSKAAARAEPATATAAFLQPYLTAAAAPVAAAPPPTVAMELEQARALSSAWLLDPAATVYTATLDTQPVGTASLALAREVADLDAERQAWREGLTAMERAVPNYVQQAPGALTEADWRRLFPRPYLDAVSAAANANGLDLNLVYGLMRQESGFDARSVSPAAARGLMQLELATARLHTAELPARLRTALGSGPLESEALFDPAVNVALGTAELGSLVKKLPAAADAVAGYDAGAARVQAWLGSYPGLETAEFIECIPFLETRDYAQAVLRNAARYAALYPSR